MEVEAATLAALVPSWSSVLLLFSYLGYLAFAALVLPGKVVPGAVLPDGSRLRYPCNGLLALFLLLALMVTGAYMEWMSITVIADKGLELLSSTFIFSLFVSLVLYAAGSSSRSQSSSLKPHVTGNFIHDWWFGVQLNPHFMGVDLKFFLIRAGMMAWLLINLSVLAKSYLAGTVNISVILYQIFCAVYVIDYFYYEEFMTSTWDIIAERLGFMLVFGDLVFVPFTFSIQGWWLLKNEVELPKVAAAASFLVFVIGYRVFREANKQKYVFKKNPKADIWGKPPKVIGGKLLASGYWGISRHCNYLGDLILAFSFSLPCGASSVIPYFYPIYLFILLIWRERRDEARCSQKYKEVWVEYCKLVPWRIFPYVY
ncbi:delta(14)-sterol reductase [Typha angustifolia]|uniref:delta(14)-sterol reductase n=1 Tax=Typha angustifolia TaxID=59011 RepID=UPI003C2BB188